MCVFCHQVPRAVKQKKISCIKNMRQKHKILDYVQEWFHENDKTLLREIKDQT